MIITSHQMTTAQLYALDRLLAECRTEDGAAPNVYHHLLSQRRLLPINYLYYQKKQLIAFLSAYFFYEDMCEIAVLVQPKMRRQGIGRQLIQAICPIVQNYGRQKLIFSTPAKRNDAWLSALGFSYDHSEYRMRGTITEARLLQKKHLHFRPATTEDLSFLCDLDSVAFPDGHNDMHSRFTSMFAEANYTIMMILENENRLGKAHIRWESHGAIFSDISILPDLQGKGYGSALLAYCMNHALANNKPNLALGVETTNNHALSLYTNLGFAVHNATDYWSVPIETLRENKFL